MIKIAITGHGTLADATRTCCSNYHEVVDRPVKGIDLLWICHDTPIGEDDMPDNKWVIENIAKDCSGLDSSTLILVSSQLPVGTTAILENMMPALSFSYSPENIRVATAVEDFKNQSRIVVGSRSSEGRAVFEELLRPFSQKIIFTTPETAEMVKHALNCYLGMSIAFINEIARICRLVNADVEVVSLALKTDSRISPKAPLRAGPPFGGGHLSRDIYTMSKLAKESGIKIPIISHIRESNQ